MGNQQNQTVEKVHGSPAGIRMLQGAGIALIVISMFVFSVNHPKPEWGQYWMVRPLLITPLAGAMGGLFYYWMDYLRCLGGWRTVAAYIISFIGYMIVLWLGTVLGLVGTLWD